MIVAALLGALAGVFCGLVPGLHTNLIAGAVVLVSEDAWWWVVFLISFAVARSIVDAVPSVFLGVSDDALSLHPAQVLLKQGKGMFAVKCSISGALFGLFACVLIAPFLWLIFPPLASVLKPFLFWLVLAAVVWLIVSEELWFAALVIFAMSGVFGLLVLDSVSEPLFPMLSGLFGASGMLLALVSGGSVCVQELRDVKVQTRLLLPGTVSGVLAGCLLMLVPGLGPSQGAALLSGKSKAGEFLVLTGALGTVDVVASLLTVAVLGKARNGAVVAIQSLFGELSIEMFGALVGAALIGAGVAAIASVVCAKAYVRLFDQIEQRFIHASVLCLLVVGSIVLCGWRGLLVLFVGASIGLLAPLVGVSRSHAMGCLLLPVLFWLW